MFFVILVAGVFAGGPPVREHRIETPVNPPRCISDISGGCSAPSWAAPVHPRAPLRDCPEGTTMGTVRPGIRYCIPDRTIGQ